jgi:hypothetical protein
MKSGFKVRLKIFVPCDMAKAEAVEVMRTIQKAADDPSEAGKLLSLPGVEIDDFASAPVSARREAK